MSCQALLLGREAVLQFLEPVEHDNHTGRTAPIAGFALLQREMRVVLGAHAPEANHMLVQEGIGRWFVL